MEQGIATLTPALIVTWTLVAAAFFALAILVHSAVRNRTSRIDLEEAIRTFQALDIDAFRNLIDPSEDEFLRGNLPPTKFRQVRRQRAWAAFLYTWEAGGAAVALARIGQAAQRSSDPRVVASGTQLTQSALRLRMQTVGVGLHFLITVLFPDFHGRTLPTFVDQYERATLALAFCKPSVR